LRPVRVIRSFASWLIMARGLQGSFEGSICSPIELLCDFNVEWILGKRIMEAAMPKLKRVGNADNRGATDFIESLDRGLRVLEVFGGSRQPMMLSDLAKAADLPRATARRILFTLERAGFVATDGKLFRLMPRVLVLASSYLASNHVVSVLQPALDRLSGEAQEISSMAILDGNDVVFIARASPTRIFSSGIDIGYRLPAFCTSVGRVLLSQLPDDELAAVLDKMDLAPLTPFTVTDKKRLQKTIIADRAKGYSLVDREAEPGFRSISVPIRRYDGAIVAAINMGAHVDRVSSAEMVERFLPRLREAAASVKSMLV
jgi:IclR family transcriptional regulator, pca regulon regulatory protein